MRTSFLALILISLVHQSLNAQAHFVSRDYQDYYKWYNERSQTPQLYVGGSSLYIFTNDTPVHSRPTLKASITTQLPIGTKVTNIGYPNYNFPEDNIGGYGDIWHHVKGTTPAGKAFSGYVWGGNIAKSWAFNDLNGDQQKELILLGISAQRRTNLPDIKADIRIISEGKLIAQTTVPGLCVFEDCDASNLVRIIENQPYAGTKILEVSTMSMGCYAGIEKAFYFWNGQYLEPVFHAEYTIDKTYDSQSFVCNNSNENQTMICRYDHEDQSYNPVWNCQPLNRKSVDEDKTAKTAVAYQERSKAK